MIEKKLKKLIQNFPVGESWTNPETFTDFTEISETKIHLVGLSSQTKDKQYLTGAAASLEAPPIERAYFEYFERVATYLAKQNPRKVYPLYNLERQKVRPTNSQEVFPPNPQPKTWRFASSNGIAAGPDWKSACLSAAYELIERDQLLRCWLGEFSPTKIEKTPVQLPKALLKHYTFEYFQVGQYLLAPFTSQVVGVFAFPKQKQHPRVYGTAARGTLDEAINCATQECLQGLGFLWGEEIPEKIPEFAPTPLYHQEYYLYPAHHSIIKNWLSGGHTRNIDKNNSDPHKNSKILFADLTPQTSTGNIRLVKAIDPTLKSLTFGQINVQSQLPIHPFV